MIDIYCYLLHEGAEAVDEAHAGTLVTPLVLLQQLQFPRCTLSMYQQ
jgi:hypothetical protein